VLTVGLTVMGLVVVTVGVEVVGDSDGDAVGLVVVTVGARVGKRVVGADVLRSIRE
jgi:uncharacterized membrane protein YqgA involved in biofilm formation